MASSETPPLAPASNDSASFFQPNEIRSATDADFEYFVQLADDRGDSWIKKLDKNGLIIWQKESGVSSIKMARVSAVELAGQVRQGSFGDLSFCSMHGACL